MNLSQQHKKSATTAIDSISASELLKALHTLQNIHLIQQDLHQDLNISFSQKDGFNHDEVGRIDENKNDFNDEMKIWPNQHKQQIKESNQNSEIKKGKMNFQFYMCKKQDNGKNKNRQKSARISVTSQASHLKKTYEDNKSTHKTSIKSLIKNANNNPMTERSLNSSCIIKDKSTTKIDKQCRLKTQANQSENRGLEKISKISMPFYLKNSVKNKNKENQTPSNAINKHDNIKEKQKGIPSKSAKSNAQLLINQSSIHERTLEFIRQKNQKLAKLTQQAEDKKKQEERECTFKPKIISKNTNVKSKYNDLCCSQKFNQKHGKRCKKQEEKHVNQESQCRKLQNYTNNKPQQFKKTISDNKSLTNNNKSIADKCIQNESKKQQTNCQKMTVKYRNSKFNTLLDMIN